MAPETVNRAVLRVQPQQGWVPIDLAELWRYRELMFYMTWRDIKVRYRQTALGVLWALFVPLTSVFVFTIVFGRMANVSSDGLPYPLFNLVALLPWNFFSQALSQAANSVAGSAGLMSKVYFPRLIAPMASVLGGLPDFLITFVLVMVALLVYRHPPGPAILALPFFIALALMSALGVGMLLAGLGTKYRDIKHVVPFLIQLWLFATPVVYSSNAITERWRVWIGLNPMAGVVEGFRWALLGLEPNPRTIALSATVAVLSLIGGAIYYRRVERNFADYL